MYRNNKITYIYIYILSYINRKSLLIKLSNKC